MIVELAEVDVNRLELVHLSVFKPCKYIWLWMARTKQTRTAAGAQVENKNIYERVSLALIEISATMLKNVQDGILAQISEDSSFNEVLLRNHTSRKVDELKAELLQKKHDLATVIALLDGGQEDDGDFEYLNHRGVKLTEEIEWLKINKKHERAALKEMYACIDKANLRVQNAASFRTYLLHIHELQVKLHQADLAISMMLARLEITPENDENDEVENLNESIGELVAEIEGLEKEKKDAFAILEAALDGLERLNVTSFDSLLAVDYNSVVHEARARVIPLLLTEDTHRRHARINGTNAESARYALRTA